MDAPLHEGAGGDGLTLVGLRQDPHAFLPGLFKQQAFHFVVVLKTILSPGGVENPVADIDHIQQTSEFLFAQFQLHTMTSSL